MAVMTTRFVSAAELMARVLGFPGYEFAVIAHPISSASDEGLRDMASRRGRSGSAVCCWGPDSRVIAERISVVIRFGSIRRLWHFPVDWRRRRRGRAVGAPSGRKWHRSVSLAY